MRPARYFSIIQLSNSRACRQDDETDDGTDVKSCVDEAAEAVL